MARKKLQFTTFAISEDLKVPWYSSSKVFCDGILVFKVGSTKPRLDVDIWSGNHPFYTGSLEIVDSEGRVERFKRKYEGLFDL
jgi:large subunit ribosomal protein L31